jgi:hypothetical protein
MDVPGKRKTFKQDCKAVAISKYFEVRHQVERETKRETPKSKKTFW